MGNINQEQPLFYAFGWNKTNRLRPSGHRLDSPQPDIIDYIEVCYHRAQHHSHLGGVSPEAFEQASS
ncbi:hypothetical protein F9U42_16030 [Pectobacterium versatile]|nr:hypothetical protein [Pectobacterium versatile]